MTDSISSITRCGCCGQQLEVSIDETTDQIVLRCGCTTVAVHGLFG